MIVWGLRKVPMCGTRNDYIFFGGVVFGAVIFIVVVMNLARFAYKIFGITEFRGFTGI
jgi:hypothetical protein